MSVRYNKAPFPWFGGKQHAAPLLWALLGDPIHYVSAFAGALGDLLERPHPCNRTYYSETISDTDGLLVNAWRAIQWHPDATAEAASWPVSELDKQARQIALLKWQDEKVTELLAGSATWCDPQMAGWWLYAVCCQIGAFDGRAPWTADPVTGRIVRVKEQEPGVSRGLPHLSSDGRGVNHAGLREPGVKRDLPHLSHNGQGVHRPQLREPGVSEGEEFHPLTMPELRRWFAWLAARLRHVRIVNGDWARVCTKGARITLPVRQGLGVCGVFLDPPYTTARDQEIYRHEVTGDLHQRIVDWALAAQHDPRTRIVVAGFAGEYPELEAAGWTVHEWYTAGFLRGGYGNLDGTSQQAQERLWGSPHCNTVGEKQLTFF